jgi:hypothetical protein
LTEIVYPEIVNIEFGSTSVPDVMSLKVMISDEQRIDSVMLNTLVVNVVAVPVHISYY